MSRLKEFHDLEDALKIQLAQLEILRNEDELVAELEFEKKLITLMKRHGKQTDDVIAILKWHPSTAENTVHEAKAHYDSVTHVVAKKPAFKKPSTKRQ
jgi:hypothetical protein